ncbi:Septin-type guanine nucleotide-binding (G) domain-containing protein [Cokeromyces recurvatus]|uniref:Septin-type guanine nucleotide-binding (G) domain-containing protein n=1 Tax=Cokeromyces recurvatus TaxID=90255 RepID=UPI0022210E9B|nr:Septin-type guanine nucleotide-binding (G) domain-containing protein [Cokeromyces recurvatus]KAI7902626.1 Septin-type guanine nucleotide-binding (G) domain-containing protein [Cokeromyces recurvatus]
MSPRPRKNQITYFNIMVVGFSGVGKTSFIRTLLETLSLEQQLEDEIVSTKNMKRRDSFMSENSSIIFHEQPQGPIEKTLQPYTISKEIINIDAIHHKKERIMLTLIDTPGFSAEYLVDKQLHDIIKYIEHQFDLTLAEESKVKRNPKAVDTQVHCCLYFIDPKKTELNEYDIRILRKLSKRVNIIPVIGKADNLTLAQRNRLKPSIMRDIYTTHKIPIYGMPEEEEDDDYDNDNDNELNKKVKTNERETSLDQFLSGFNYEKEDNETKSILDYLRIVPFTFIAYEDDPETGNPIDTHNPQIKLGRDFGWGIIDCLNDKFSDFIKLKHILLSSHRQYLQLDTVERYYEQYRTERLMYKRATRIGLASAATSPH